MQSGCVKRLVGIVRAAGRDQLGAHPDRVIPSAKEHNMPEIDRTCHKAAPHPAHPTVSTSTPAVTTAADAVGLTMNMGVELCS